MWSVEQIVSNPPLSPNKTCHVRVIAPYRSLVLYADGGTVPLVYDINTFYNKAKLLFLVGCIFYFYFFAM